MGWAHFARSIGESPSAPHFARSPLVSCRTLLPASACGTTLARLMLGRDERYPGSLLEETVLRLYLDLRECTRATGSSPGTGMAPSSGRRTHPTGTSSGRAPQPAETTKKSAGCESNFIEMYWGKTKFRYRTIARTSNIDEMAENVKACLNDVPSLTILRYANRVARFISAYAQGLTGGDLIWIKQRTEVILPPSMIAEIKASRPRFRSHV
ncbi:hypothetical protein B0H13DRAFT_2340918 [Mycena leptocephala]|nr:hypothetical protein B0H13DRAFT_2340918 [Mycena leptocephala]